MNQKYEQLAPIKKQEAARRLIDDLFEFDVQTLPTSEADNEMLSLIIDEVLKGVDISVRYPTFYQKLLHNADLRQTFVDVLESMEKASENESIKLPKISMSNLPFLTNQKPHSNLEKFGKNQWRITWQQTIEHLQSIFSPPELVYRSDPSLFEDPWLTLLRGEVDVAGSQYIVLLECSLAKDSDEALAVSLNLAVTLETPAEATQNPLYATLQWGLYDESLPISDEGRTRFPHIPFQAILDEENQRVMADLNLILETSP